MEGRQLRDRDEIALDLVGVLGLSAFVLGLVMLEATELLGFDAAAALNGVVSQLTVTVPVALLVLAATTLELAAGLVLARAARRRPFDSVAETLLAAMVAAVLKDTVLLGLLGGFGLFLAPVLIGLNLLILLLALGPSPISRYLRPLVAFGSWRDAVASIGSIPIAALVAIVWAGPMVLQLASPVVPFVDVLPNYVGPVEHLRTFGWFSPLTATQSPIIGPSRTVLGYDGLLGSLATMTNLPGAFAISGFILPQTILVAAGAHRLAGALRRGDAPIGAWALLAFALSQPFARLGDARGTVVVVPLVCLGLAVAVEALRRGVEGDAKRVGPERDHAGSASRTTSDARSTARADLTDPWRIGRGAVVGLALGSSTLVHPVIGFFAIITVAIAALVRPRELAAPAFVATLTAGLVALPQLATMVGMSLPTLVLGIGLPIAIAIGVGVGRLVERDSRVRDGLVRLASFARIAIAVAAVGGVAVAFAVGAFQVDRFPNAINTTVKLIQESSGILLVMLLVGAIFGSAGARSPIVVVGLCVGAVAVLVTQALPRDLGFLGDALRFEVPKTVHYWLSLIAAAGAAAALAHVWATERLPWVARAAIPAAFVLAAALPIRPEPINSYHLGEHRYSETFAIDLRWAGRGFWAGFPDARLVVDGPRQEILDAVRVEIEAGRLRHDTPVLHVASTFQQHDATPLGVFAGVTETSVSLKPEVSHQTVGGRLFGLDDLPGFLASGEFPYLVLEPEDLPGSTRDSIAAAGYVSIYSNGQGEVFVASE